MNGLIKANISAVNLDINLTRTNEIERLYAGGRLWQMKSVQQVA